MKQREDSINKLKGSMMKEQEIGMLARHMIMDIEDLEPHEIESVQEEIKRVINIKKGSMMEEFKVQFTFGNSIADCFMKSTDSNMAEIYGLFIENGFVKVSKDTWLNLDHVSLIKVEKVKDK